MTDAREARIRAYERWICDELAAMGGYDPRDARGTVLDFPYVATGGGAADGADGADTPSRRVGDRPNDPTAGRRSAEQGAGARR